jgi:hypothetical protein
MTVLDVEELKKLLKNRIIIFTGILVVAATYVYSQNNRIEAEHINIKTDKLPKELEGLKIAHVSDVHIPRKGPGIKNLLKILNKENPDIIVLTGDILDRSGDLDNPYFSELCKGLADITDTYAVTGNHEVRKNSAGKWAEALDRYNVKVVENRIEIYRKGNSMVAVMGLKDNCGYSPEYFENIETVKDTPKILLAHRPELFDTYYSDSHDIKPDLVFSGHAHGGQFRIPFINKGIAAPNQGFFPEYTSGLYTSDNGVQMIVSRGLGNSIIPVRINNRPHLPIIYLRGAL